MVISVSTADVSNATQFDYWYESAIEQHYVRLEAVRNERMTDGYNARMYGLRFGGWAVNDVLADPMRVNRTMHSVRQNPVSYVQVSMLTSGRSMVMQDGRVAVQSEPYDLVFVDPLAPYIFEFERRSRQVQIQIPRDLAMAAIPHIDDLTARTISGRSGLGQLTVHALLGLNAYREDRSDDFAFTATSSALDLLAELVRETTGDDSSPSTSDALLARARSYLMRHMADGEMVVPTRVAAAISVSERYLYKLFERENTTPHRWLREARLTRARRMLEEPTETMSIESIGQCVGFSSAAHFSRAFSSHFGLSPRDVRMAVRAESAPRDRR